MVEYFEYRIFLFKLYAYSAYFSFTNFMRNFSGYISVRNISRMLISSSLSSLFSSARHYSKPIGVFLTGHGSLTLFKPSSRCDFGIFQSNFNPLLSSIRLTVRSKAFSAGTASSGIVPFLFSSVAP